MHNPLITLKFKIYKILVARKQRRAVEAEQRFVKQLSPAQKDLYEKTLELLKKPDTEVVYVDSKVVIKTEDVVIDIEVALNRSVMNYTARTDKGTFHTEQVFDDNSKLFFLQHVEVNFQKKKKAMLELKSRMLENIYDSYWKKQASKSNDANTKSA